MIIRTFIIIILTFVINLNLYAQNFYGGIRGGMNMSQVDGDGFGGYKKLAPFGGVYVRNTFGDTWGAMLGIEYKHKGAKEVTRINGAYIPKHEIRLDYIVVPITATYKLERFKIPGAVDHEFRNDFLIEFGVSYSYLIKAEEQEGDGSISQGRGPYNNYDLLTHQGFSYRLNDSFFISFRHYWTFFFYRFPIRKHPGESSYWFNFGEYNRNAELSLTYEF